MSARRCAWLAMVAVVLAACGRADDPAYQGWVEADLVFVSPDEPGRVEILSVREGNTVTAGAPLFTVDDDLQQADLKQNQAAVTNARQAFDRAQVLLKTNVGTQKAFEDAEAALRTAEARLNSSQTRLARRKVASPVTGTVQQVYFRPGELVPAGRPVVALLPPANMKLRFFVSEAVLPKIALDETVRVTCDGCTPDLTARISFIARTAEFTPPVIYSLEERAKLVFLVEARPERPEAFRVGQPVSVALLPPEPRP
ncbi:MAG: HlyD family secretion protein [Alphaproteobacteria bacterium]|nr:HlyD family secretion protein [Alphaproteobacteria bacterium]